MCLALAERCKTVETWPEKSRQCFDIEARCSSMFFVGGGGIMSRSVQNDI